MSPDGHRHDGPEEAHSSDERLRRVIEHASHLLPAQGPISVFIHHNTLHAFEHLPFEEAVKRGAQVFGCQTYLSEDRFREELGKGRIRYSELREVIEEDLANEASRSLGRFGNLLDLRLAMMQYPHCQGPKQELLWFVAETEALRKVRSDASGVSGRQLVAETRRWVMRDLRAPPSSTASAGSPAAVRPAWVNELFERFDESKIENWDDKTWESFTLNALWRVCVDGVSEAGELLPQAAAPARHRDLLLRASAEDADLLVHDLLFRFCAAFVDQGLSHWPLPNRDQGFLRSFALLYGQRLGPPEAWMAGLAGELRRILDRGTTAIELIEASLLDLGVPEAEWEPFVSASLLAIRGWAGIVSHLELRGDRAHHACPPGSLAEFLAVRLLLDRFALRHVARRALGYQGPLAELAEAVRRPDNRQRSSGVEQRAFMVFQLAQVLGWSPSLLSNVSADDWRSLVGEIEQFDGLERRRLFHLAYERRFRTQALDAISMAGRRPIGPGAPPRFQAVFCIDEREESIRRHVEELAPQAETFGAAGFFGVAMYYRGVTDAHFVPLCPVVVKPRHWVQEQVEDGQVSGHARRSQRLRAFGAAWHRLHMGTRTFALGAVVAAGVGVLASIPLVARTVAPRLAARSRKVAERFVYQPPRTRLLLERTEAEPGQGPGQLGYSIEEMTGIAERLLSDIGLTRGFSRLVLILGHGSTSLNNPHESAHDCGACGGGVGGPNARAIAQILNDPRIRAGLAARGLVIGQETVFVGGLHNTCSETVTYFDADRVPVTHRHEFDDARRILEEACGRNAHERSRRFHNAPLTLDYRQAREHMEERSEDLAQVRPEWGHATNAMCIVGRRSRTRSLFLDRRAFLVSYDPHSDTDDHAILTRILSAVVPVCSGISLEYYFSYVDPTGWGCGTKLPHNITSLLGVMDGAASDLRTGLPWQMVEIHEPVRLLFVIESTPAALAAIIARHPGIGDLCRNRWVQVATLSPDSGDIHVLENGELRPYQPQSSELPRAAASLDWYRGWREHLEFAQVASGRPDARRDRDGGDV
jgi:hypothetical protein